MNVSAEDLTEEEINTLLARYDQTSPSLQRKIVAQFVIDNMILQSENESLRCELAAMNPVPRKKVR